MPDFLTLNTETLVEAAQAVARADPDLARVLETLGPPPLWDRPQGFATLVYIILEQQVSLASARAAYKRLEATLGTITPAAFLTLSDEELKAIGFSRQKTGYSRLLAQAVLDGSMDLDGLALLSDDGVKTEITKMKGLGRWSAEIYLMEALLRPDVWPSGDLALAIAVKQVKGLEATPAPQALEALGEIYRPWRSVAARLFWHFYLSR